MNREEFIKRAIQKHGEKYDYSKVEYVSINKKVIIILDGVEYLQTPVKHLMGRCPEKNTPKMTQEEFINKAIKVWGNKYDYSLVDYKGADKKIKIIYDGIIFEQNAFSHLSGNCPENRISTTENFIRLAKKTHKDRYDYSMTRFTGINNSVLIGYKGVFYTQSPYSHIRGRRPELLKRKKSNNKFIQDANNTHDYKYCYDKVEYVKNSEKVIITCRLHGDFEQTPQCHLLGQGCSKCNSSKGEIEISKFLNKNNILFDRQKKFIDCANQRPLPFDFYIPSFRTCIEFDGEQHYKAIERFGGEDGFRKVKINDEIKNKYCEDNFINLIRIRHDQIDDIWNILWENLKILIRVKKLK